MNLPQNIKTIQGVLEFARYLKNNEDVSVSWSDDFNEYINFKTLEPTFTKEQAEVLNELRKQAFEICKRNNVDIYELTNTD